MLILDIGGDNAVKAFREKNISDASRNIKFDKIASSAVSIAASGNPAMSLITLLMMPRIVRFTLNTRSWQMQKIA